MATTVGPPTGADTPPPSTSPSAYDGLRSARTALSQHESPRRRIVRLLVLLVAVLVLVRGWMVTEIDLGKLSNAQNATPILRALIQPDIASRDVTPIELLPFEGMPLAKWNAERPVEPGCGLHERARCR